MQLNLLKPAALLLLGGLCSASAFAQNNATQSKRFKDETIVIRKDRKDGRTVVEIKDGKVYVNGDPVVTIQDGDGANVHKKVIIEDGGGKPQDEAFHFDDEGGGFPDMPGSRHAMLGVMTDPKSGKAGAMVKGVTPGSAAEDAGLRAGDVITRVDGKTIKGAEALVAEIGTRHEPGDKVTITYERNGKEQTTSARLQPAEQQWSMRSFRMNPNDMNGDMPNSMFRTFPFPAMDDMSPTPKLGVGAEDRADGDGVRVLSVKPGSPADDAGLKEGDVITRFGNDKIGSVDELQMSLRSRKGGDRVMLEYQREGKPAAVEVKLPKPVRKKDL
jgi:serine protease Do